MRGGEHARGPRLRVRHLRDDGSRVATSRIARPRHPRPPDTAKYRPLPADSPPAARAPGLFAPRRRRSRHQPLPATAHPPTAAACTSPAGSRARSRRSRPGPVVGAAGARGRAGRGPSGAAAARGACGAGRGAGREARPGVGRRRAGARAPCAMGRRYPAAQPRRLSVLANLRDRELYAPPPAAVVRSSLPGPGSGPDVRVKSIPLHAVRVGGERCSWVHLLHTGRRGTGFPEEPGEELIVGRPCSVSSGAGSRLLQECPVPK